ncbi:hypothetical protein LCGC14_1612980 [marine sediment metagenome]|uniref:Uncharacterized protein n=1 Tax=marine sediment metagenome TaxID=412755 RepID=A0A0F9L7V8_9ZZZZ
MDKDIWSIIKLGTGQFGLVFMGMAVKSLDVFSQTEWKLIVLMFVLSVFIQITLLFSPEEPNHDTTKDS